MADDFKTQFAERLAEGEFEKAADVQEKMIWGAIMAGQAAWQRGNPIRAWFRGEPLEKRALRRLTIVIGGAVTIVLIVAVAIGGGIFAVAPGQGSGINGGVYIINKYTGEANWCPPGGGCRPL